MKFTQGDFRRFCLLFYLITRKLLQTAELIVLRDGKKRIMPRHLINAAVATGIIPYKLYVGQKVHASDHLLIQRLKAEQKLGQKVVT